MDGQTLSPGWSPSIPMMADNACEIIIGNHQFDNLLLTEHKIINMIVTFCRLLINPFINVLISQTKLLIKEHDFPFSSY